MKVPCDLDPMDMIVCAVLEETGRFPKRVGCTIISDDTEARIVITDPQKLRDMADWLSSAADEISGPTDQVPR